MARRGMAWASEGWHGLAGQAPVRRWAAAAEKQAKILVFATSEASSRAAAAQLWSLARQAPFPCPGLQAASEADPRRDWAGTVCPPDRSESRRGNLFSRCSTVQYSTPYGEEQSRAKHAAASGQSWFSRDRLVA